MSFGLIHRGNSFIPCLIATYVYVKGRNTSFFEDLRHLKAFIQLPPPGNTMERSKLDDNGEVATGHHRENPRSFFVDWGMVEGLPRIMSGVRVDNLIKGYIGILCADGRCPDELLFAADAVAEAFSMEFRNTGNFASEIRPLHNVFLAKLFQGDIKKAEEITEWAGHLNIELEGDYCIVAAGAAELITDASLIHYLHRRLEVRLAPLFSLVYDNCIFVLFTGISGLKGPFDHIPLIEATLKAPFSEHHLIGGISDRFDDLLDLSSYVYQAKQALILRGGTGNGLLTPYRSLVLQDIMSKIQQNMEPVNYIHPVIPFLTSYDKTNGTQYLETAKTYIITLCNSTESCRLLNIHRNTLLYRLDKISELTGIEIKSIGTFTHLLCSFYLMA